MASDRSDTGTARALPRIRFRRLFSWSWCLPQAEYVCTALNRVESNGFPNPELLNTQATEPGPLQVPVILKPSIEAPLSCTVLEVLVVVLTLSSNVAPFALDNDSTLSVKLPDPSSV
jgi:hypothetical protein